jgi:hypothetical protein
MEDIKNQINEILDQQNFGLNSVSMREKAIDEILQLISDNYEPKKKERYNCPECGGRE